MIYYYIYREKVLEEMGVALKEDGATIGVFSPKKVYYMSLIFLGSFYFLVKTGAHHDSQNL